MLSIRNLSKTYPNGVRNDQRNPSYWLFNVKATKDWDLGKRMRLLLSIEVFNLLNDGTVSVYNPSLESGRQINGRNEPIREFGRRFQFGAWFSF